MIKDKTDKRSALLIEVRVIPKSQKIEIIKMGEATFKVKLTEAPEKDKANKQCIEILAEYFKVNKSDISIVSGRHSRNKKIAIMKNERKCPN